MLIPLKTICKIFFFLTQRACSSVDRASVSRLVLFFLQANAFDTLLSCYYIFFLPANAFDTLFRNLRRGNIFGIGEVYIYI